MITDPRFSASRIGALPASMMTTGSRRLDAEVYLTPGFLYRLQIESLEQSQALADLARVWQPSRLKGVQVPASVGVPFIAATQVFDIWPIPRKWLAASQTPDLDSRFLAPGTIVVTCSGNVGEALIAYDAHRRIAVSHDLLRIQPHEKRMTGYVYTYLRTRYGRALMRSSRYGNVIKHLEPEHLGSVPVPVLSDLVDTLSEDVADVFMLRDEAWALDAAAQRRLGVEIGEVPDAPPETGFSIDATLFFSRSRRLNAYAHNPEALAVLVALSSGRRLMTPLKEVATVTQPSRFARVYGERGVPYLSTDELFRVNAEITKFLTEATAVDLDELRVRAGWLLMSCSGQIYGLNGSVTIATQWHEDKVVTHDMIRIVPHGVRPGYLRAVLSHPKLGRPLALRNAYGTSIPHLESPDIAETPIVRLAEAVEIEIADMVERASVLRMKADKKEDSAVAKLEKRIDHALAVEGAEGGPVKVNLPFDEAIRRALKVSPPKGGWATAEERPARKRRSARRA